MTDMNLIDGKSLREKYINRVDVLDKVKALFLVPELDMMTTTQVAGYYEVGVEAIKSCYKNNKDEIDKDGSAIKTSADILKLLKNPLVKTQVKIVFQFSDERIVEFPNRGIRCFSKRAILRIGMLLRDSKVAKEVRVQLLNTFERSTPFQKTEELDIELQLCADIGKAYLAKDFDGFMLANQNYIEHQNRYINILKNDNKALAGEILEWEDRSKINYAIRALANKIYTGYADKGYAKMWSELYKELKYKHHIDVKQRTSRDKSKKSYIQYVREDEWPHVMESFSAICKSYYLNPSVILDNLKSVK